ncbi:hypothetical protein, partial [Microbispora amethystogenes]|uniref:hypothetical protein n=1 Tax=Microbispora amethystogenes TaxID=1427754 RepID=UPI001952D8CC
MSYPSPPAEPSLGKLGRVSGLGNVVTPPLPEGSGFSLSRFRSVAKGKPCPENVLGRVHVGVRLV